MVVSDYETFTEHILDHEAAAIVYFSDSDEANEDLQTLDKIYQKTGDYINSAFYHVSKEDFPFSGPLPQFRTFRNKHRGDKKVQSSYQVLL